MKAAIIHDYDTEIKIADAVLARANQQDAGAIAQIARLKVTEMALKPETSAIRRQHRLLLRA
jgi:hypothetical protein